MPMSFSPVVIANVRIPMVPHIAMNGGTAFDLNNKWQRINPLRINTYKCIKDACKILNIKQQRVGLIVAQK